MFEWAWKKTERIRLVVEERDSLFPAYRRVDLHLWKKWKFYPGAMLWLVTRAALIIFNLCFILLGTRIAYFGKDVSKPLSGCRRRVWMKFMDIQLRFMIRLVGYR